MSSSKCCQTPLSCEIQMPLPSNHQMLSRPKEMQVQVSYQFGEGSDIEIKDDGMTVDPKFLSTQRISGEYWTLVFIKNFEDNFWQQTFMSPVLKNIILDFSPPPVTFTSRAKFSPQMVHIWQKPDPDAKSWNVPNSSIWV